MLGRGGGKHEVENLLSEPEASRVAGANAQPPEVWGAKLRGNVLQSVVTRIAAALLEAHASGQQVELVVNDKNGARQNFVVERERDDGLTRSVHEGRGLQEPNVASFDAGSATFAVKLLLFAKSDAEVIS